MVLLPVAFLLTGCDLAGVHRYAEPVAMTDNSLIGSWRNTTHSGSITFNADHTFTATDVRGLLEDDSGALIPSGLDLPTGTRIDGSGRWELDNAIGNPSDFLSQVDLDFTHLSPGSLDGGYSTAVTAARFKNGVLLQCPVTGGTYLLQEV